MSQHKDLLAFNLNTLKFLFVWPFSERSLATGSYARNQACFIITPGILLMLCVCGDFYRQVGLGLRDSVATVTENILVIVCMCTLLYSGVCYQLQMKNLLSLHKRLTEFDQFGVPPDQDKAEQMAHFVSKAYFIYGVFACVVYFFLPFFFMSECERRKPTLTYSQHIPCGMFSRLWLPFRFDHSPMFVVAEAILIFPLTLFSLISIATFTLLFGFIMHVTSHLSNFKRKLYIAVNGDDPRETVSNCVWYHIEIIRFCDSLNACFSKLSFLVISVTTLALSILAFELVQFISLYESFRMALHFIGWLTVLFLACVAGQLLIDESESVYHAAFDTNWPDADVSVQKCILLIILRAQKPLSISTGAFGILSLEVFLSITSTAYTYFTLLVSQ